MFNDTLDELEKLDDEQKINFDLVWTLFPPGSIFCTRFYLNPPFALRVKNLTQDEYRLKLTCESVVFDGYRYGTLEFTFRVYAFDGIVDVGSIPDMPFVDLGRNPELRSRLIERGKKALDMQTIQYMTYKPKNSGEDGRDTPWLEEDVSYTEQVSMIEILTYNRRNVESSLTPICTT